MIIESMTIGHLRCIEDCEVVFGPYIAIVGANGVGKSTILEAVRFMLDPSFRATSSDVNVCSPGTPLSVTMCFGRLTTIEREAWAAYVGADGLLKLRKTATRDATGATFAVAFHGQSLRHDAFAPLWGSLDGNKTIFKANYAAFRTTNPGYGLPAVTRWEDAQEALATWEAEHTDKCTVRDVTIDAKVVLPLLADAFRVVHVPAVSPAEDALVGRQSGLSELINQMLWQSVLARPELIALQTKVREEYRAIFPVEGSTELDAAQDLINASLALFAPGTSLKLGWNPESLPSIRPPEYQTVVVEDGVENDVSLKGHGVQRAMVVAVLNALNEDNNANHPSEGGAILAPTTILLVEEPELYQHPTRARHFARALGQLATIEDSKPRMQVVLTTHSPYFVSLARFDAIRVVRRDRSDSRPSPKRRVSMALLDDIAQALRQARGYAPNSDEERAIIARLGTLMDTEVREGFFADAVVLVEGTSDVAAIAAALGRSGVDVDGAGIALLAAGGSGTLDKLWLVFDRLGIPVYLIFDADAPKPESAATNARLLTLLGAPAVAHPKTTVEAKYAVFEVDREATMRSEFGPDYDRFLDEACKASGYERVQGEKVASIVEQVYAQLDSAGRLSPTLERVCAAITALLQ